jgi:hypothetical protein
MQNPNLKIFFKSLKNPKKDPQIKKRKEKIHGRFLKIGKTRTLFLSKLPLV